MKPIIKYIIIFVLGLLCGSLPFVLVKSSHETSQEKKQEYRFQTHQEKQQPSNQETPDSETNIGALTQERVVVAYLKEHHELPNYYVTKSQARQGGWQPGKDLCKSVPGKAIGGDKFSNRQKILPDQEGRQWYEADINYNCGKRGADRLVFSNDDLIYVSHDHYKTFEKL